mmetsp:Transcript_7646/g.11354  ORF Transcript_7646/g.11354 Transcript_7646/m.11354 type:complete len:209 (+) Transcript_7646:22-648(+)
MSIYDHDASRWIKKKSRLMKQYKDIENGIKEEMTNNEDIRQQWIRRFNQLELELNKCVDEIDIEASKKMINNDTRVARQTILQDYRRKIAEYRDELTEKSKNEFYLVPPLIPTKENGERPVLNPNVFDHDEDNTGIMQIELSSAHFETADVSQGVEEIILFHHTSDSDDEHRVDSTTPTLLQRYQYHVSFLGIGGIILFIILFTLFVL